MLVVAPGDDVRRSVSRILARVPFQVHATGSPARGRALVEAEPSDLVVVECGAVAAMPSYLTDLRSATSAPVMLVGGQTAEGIDCLEAGFVEDYVPSPIWGPELQARAVLRAAGRRGSNVLDFGDLVIDVSARTVQMTGSDVELTAREFDLLTFLAAHPGGTFTRAELLQRVWRSSSDWQRVETVNEHVYRLRRKLEVHPSRPALIVTVPRRGYAFARTPAFDEFRRCDAS